MDGFIGEIRMMPYNYTPMGWLPCLGQQVNIYQYQALFAVVGSIYGPYNQQTFYLPDLRGRTAVCQGNNPVDLFDPPLGSKDGSVGVTLTTSNMYPHTHGMNAATVPAGQRVGAAAGNWLAVPAAVNSSSVEIGRAFTPASGAQTPVALAPATLTPYPGTGGAHENRQPYLAMPFFICYDGLFPTPN
ncbi:phage tail protein [Sphingomonas suaedae]|nr:tail fiber protein [Sphingomonas suaedae]